MSPAHPNNKLYGNAETDPVREMLGSELNQIFVRWQLQLVDSKWRDFRWDHNWVVALFKLISIAAIVTLSLLNAPGTADLDTTTCTAASGRRQLVWDPHSDSRAGWWRAEGRRLWVKTEALSWSWDGRRRVRLGSRPLDGFWIARWERTKLAEWFLHRNRGPCRPWHWELSLEDPKVSALAVQISIWRKRAF